MSYLTFIAVKQEQQQLRVDSEHADASTHTNTLKLSLSPRRRYTREGWAVQRSASSACRRDGSAGLQDLLQQQQQQQQLQLVVFAPRPITPQIITIAPPITRGRRSPLKGERRKQR